MYIIRNTNTLLNNMWVKEEISRVIKKYFEQNEKENICGTQWKQSLEMYSIECIY